MKFAYWSREIAGWLLIGLGIVAFAQAYLLLLNKRIFEATPLAFIGFIVFRGGIHVLKVAVAAQAALSQTDHAQPAARRIGRPSTRGIGPTPNTSVMPGRGGRPGETTGAG
jgi:hypothetical protein